MNSGSDTGKDTQAIAFGQKPSKANRRLGLAASVLLHLLLVAFLVFGLPQRRIELPPAGDQKAIMVSLLSSAASSSDAANPPAAASPPPPPPTVEAAPKPAVKPKAAVKKKIERTPETAEVTNKPVEPMESAQTSVTEAQPSTSPDAAAAASAGSPGSGLPSDRAMSTSPEQISRLERQYAMMVRRRVEMNMRIPRRARLSQEMGVTIVRMRLGRDGSLIEATIVTSSGYGYLDEEAQALMYRIAQFPPIPSVVRPWQDFITIDQPVSFRF